MPMKKLTTKDKQLLKGKAHKLNPIVMIGNNGLTENVRMEIDRGLTDHELIKIRIQCADRDLRKEMFNDICKTSAAEAIQLIGNVGVIYRKKPAN